MKTQYYTATSLDGFIATKDHSLEWLFPLAELELTSYPIFISEVGALTMGSSTYEWLLQHVVKFGTSDESAWIDSLNQHGYFLDGNCLCLPKQIFDSFKAMFDQSILR